ncbi:CheY chemotaxis protein or a CheY-like REC (receiver) domain [Pricia antarctica]|uniref:CheY chemotaxis protein or a CheY-like REC (Receiver) domain n=1 Tax=Pricia antarctica TaxID=641691 RepID=A0A1G7I7M6_9FLAO|nr:response regulator [Pricia antarctica]SDF08721.1 CheY chemotaxis protein or a CheY-like REC (receiver) domain [Pricia antarctica]
MRPDIVHILLVDDDADDRMFFEEALEDLDIGASFEHVGTGLEALQRLADGRVRPDIIFLDLNMPLMSGRECLERIRADHGLKDIRIVVYSTSFDPLTADRLHEEGADHYIRKPGSYDKLKQVILMGIESLMRDGKGPVAKQDFVIYS